MSNVMDQTQRERRQQMVLDSIMVFIKHEGYAPTDREISASTDIPVTTCHEIVHELIARGCISRVPGITRSIQVLRETVV